MSNFQKYFLIRYLINNEEDTGLPTKDETSEKTEQNFYYLFFFFYDFYMQTCFFPCQFIK